jgi:hypothetical protein
MLIARARIDSLKIYSNGYSLPQIKIYAALTKQKLLRISAAPSTACWNPNGASSSCSRRSHTKPGTLLKHQIPIRTFAEWDETQPGFVDSSSGP